MIILYACSILFAALILVYVLHPLFSRNFALIEGQQSGVGQLSTLLSGFSSEEELAETLELRDALLQEFVVKGGEIPETKQKELYSILQRLKASGFNAFPKNIEKFAKIILISLLGVFAIQGNSIFAQAGMPEIPESTMVTMTSDTYIPSVNQYVLSPREGKMHVYYLGIIRKNSSDLASGSQIKHVAFPFPLEIGELVLPDLPNSIVTKENNGVLVAKIDNLQDNQEIRAEFSVAASFGSYAWQNKVFPKSEGIYLFLLPEMFGEVRAMAESIYGGAKEWNMWPPRFKEVSSDLKLIRQQDKLNPQDPNYEIQQKLPPSYTWNAIRMARSAESFPEFKIVGLVPNRLWLVSLGVCFSLLLCAAIFYRWKKI